MNQQGQGAPEWARYLDGIYNNPREPGSFQSYEKLNKTTQKEGRYSLSRKRLRRWLQNQEPYSRNRLYLPHRIKRSRVIVGGLYDQFDADLADYQTLGKNNNGYRYLLMVIDIFSRYIWVEPIKSKHTDRVIEAFERIFRQGYIPRRLRTDAGGEFTAKIMKPFHKHYNITHVISLNEVKANYAERAIKTIKSKLGRYMTLHHTIRYIDVLQDIVYSYNATHHKSIGMPPDEVTTENEESVWWHQYLPKKSKRIQRFQFDVGDHVRIPHLILAFAREYRPRWTEEIFIITQKFRRDDINVYKIEDNEKEEIYGTFYEGELQRVLPDQKNQWIIENIIRERGQGTENHEAWVKFKGWPTEYNRWIPYANTQTIVEHSRKKP